MITGRTIITCPRCGRVYGTVRSCEEIELLCRRCGTLFRVEAEGRSSRTETVPFAKKVQVQL